MFGRIFASLERLDVRYLVRESETREQGGTSGGRVDCDRIVIDANVARKMRSEQEDESPGRRRWEKGMKTVRPTFAFHHVSSNALDTA